MSSRIRPIATATYATDPGRYLGQAEMTNDGQRVASWGMQRGALIRWSNEEKSWVYVLESDEATVEK